jgi:hypothetical protein
LQAADDGIAALLFQPQVFRKFGWTISVQFEAENTLQGGAMLLRPEEAHLFFKLHSSLMCFVNERLEIIPGTRDPDGYRTLSADLRLKTRNALLDNMNLVEMFVDVNPFKLSGEELNIVLSWKHQVTGKFFVFRNLKKHTVFLSDGGTPIAYGVVALTEPFEELIGPYLPVYVETVLLPFKDRIVYDGLLGRYNIFFGGGIRRRLQESYSAARERLSVVTALPALPVQPQPVAHRRATNNAQSKPSPDEVRKALQAIVGMTDGFCRERLNQEYAVLCRKLAEKLSRKRPSPLTGGTPNAWAAAIVRTVGIVNFLHDPCQNPHMKLNEVDEAFCVSKSTSQAKSLAIRKMFKIYHFDRDWTLSSRMGSNPLAWMVEVNGFMIDMRHAPRSAQEIAYRRDSSLTSHRFRSDEIGDDKEKERETKKRTSRPVAYHLDGTVGSGLRGRGSRRFL